MAEVDGGDIIIRIRGDASELEAEIGRAQGALGDLGGRARPRWKGVVTCDAVTVSALGVSLCTQYIGTFRGPILRGTVRYGTVR